MHYKNKDTNNSNYSKMVTLEFTAGKASKQLVIIPTVVVDYSDKAKKATIGLLFGWLNGVLGVSISWTRKGQE